MSRYQSMGKNKGERDCEERWEIIKNLLPKEGSVLDIGCAEGFFCYKIASETNLLPIGIEKDSSREKKWGEWLKDEDLYGKVVMCKGTMSSSLSELIASTCDWFEVSFLLSVLHWIPNPFEVLRNVSSFSSHVIVEIPNIDDRIACSQNFIKTVSSHGSIKGFLENASKREVSHIARVKAHTSSHRDVWLIHGPVTKISCVPHVNMPLPCVSENPDWNPNNYKNKYVHVFNGKKHTFSKNDEKIDWISGINLATADLLGLRYPKKEMVLSAAALLHLDEMKKKNYKGDARIHNLILKRGGIQWIDLDKTCGYHTTFSQEIELIGTGKNYEPARGWKNPKTKKWENHPLALKDIES